MLRKHLFTVAALALALVFTSCSFLTESSDSGRVTITLNQATIKQLRNTARAGDAPSKESEFTETLTLEINLKGDYEATQKINLKENKSATVTFEKIRRGSKVSLQADAYIEEPGLNEKIMLFTGSSDTIEIKTGENPVSLQLKRIYEVWFDANGGTTEYEPQRIVSGGKISKPADPVKESEGRTAYEFAGWFTSDDGGITLSEKEYDFNTPVKDYIVLYAKWITKQRFLVSYDANGGTFSDDGKTTEIYEQLIVAGKPATEPEIIPEKESDAINGYIFNGWYTSDNKPYDFSTPVTADITLYANWKVSVVAGVEIEIPLDEVSDINVSETKNEANGTWTYTADTGYDTYKWKWDGEVQTSVTSNTFTTPLNPAPGSYTVSLHATKVVDSETKYYSYTTQVEIE